MIVTAKLITIGLCAATVAFMVATIVLAVQKADLKKDLDQTNDKLKDMQESLKTTTPPAPTTTTVSNETPKPTLPTTPPIINYRLPTTVIPQHYQLYLHPDIDTGLFSGQEEITIHTTADVDQIILHSLNLEITSAYLTDGPETTFIRTHTLDPVREFLILDLSAIIPNNSTVVLGIIFNGKMAGKIVGLYSSSYLKNDGSKKMIATSKFEPTYARQAFPCFDEPGMKATFEVSLAHPKTGAYSALSNMNVQKTEEQTDYTEVTFAKSVPMSTYLTCFIVSDFASKSTSVVTNGIGDPFKISVYATPEQINKVDFALDVGKSVIEYYISYFNIAYPLPKLDMAAIPDFVSGAMEHWGLVTYRETSLLYEEGVSSSANKQRVADVIAHEFAHMWFGNLVTMQWWNDLWLNEGFAQYIEDKGVNAKFPEWQMEDQFLINTLHSVMVTDATISSHPIVQNVSNPDQITEIFDSITYSKGASIIRMLEEFLGSKIFQTAVTNYLNAYAFGNAVTTNFFNEIDKLDLDINVTQIMQTWTEQMGFPVVEVTQTSPTTFELTQKWFLANPDEYLQSPQFSLYNYKWSIPITYVTNLNSVATYVWFDYGKGAVTITLPAAVKWIKFNHKQVGFYRVNYNSVLWETLANTLLENPDEFTLADRASLINDAFALADATQLPYATALGMTRYLSKESDYVPWSVAASKLTSLKNVLMFTDTFVDYLDYARQLITPIYNKVTWIVGSDHLQNRLRVSILNAACSLGVSDCLKEAGNRLKTYLLDPTVRPHPDLRDTVYYYGLVQIGDEETWNQMWDIFVAENDASEKAKLRSGLAAVQVPWILQRFINLAWNEDYVRGQDYFSCLGSISSNRVGEPLVWDYVREHWPNLVDRFGLNERYLGNLIPTITSRFNTPTKLAEMYAFFDKYPEAGAGANARRRALSNVKNNIVWLKNNLDTFSEWLVAQKKQ